MTARPPRACELCARPATVYRNCRGIMRHCCAACYTDERRRASDELAAAAAQDPRWRRVLAREGRMEAGPPPLRCLDLFCGAGGASMGLYQAGYEVLGVDLHPQPRYPFRFLQDDAMAWLRGEREPLAGFDLIWASPKCQAHSVLTPTAYRGNHEIQLPFVLERLRAQSVPYIAENVQGAQVFMRNPIYLCGTMFGLNIWRHRWFEIGNCELFFLLPPCNHSGAPVLISGTPRRNGIRQEPSAATRRSAMQTPWMTRKEMDQAIPPAYARFLGEQARAARVSTR